MAENRGAGRDLTNVFILLKDIFPVQKHWFNLGFTLVCLCSPAANAQDLLRDFPECQCSIQLPNKDWAWQDITLLPETNGKILAFAVNKDNHRLVLVCDVVKPGETVTSNSLSSFETGFFSDVRATKVSSKTTVFYGVPCLEIVANYKKAGGAYMRVFFANGKRYQLTLTTPKSAPDPEFDSQTGFQCFSFIGQPQLPDWTKQEPVDDNAERGKLAAPCFGFCCVGFIVGGILLLYTRSRSARLARQARDDFHDDNDYDMRRRHRD